MNNEAIISAIDAEIDRLLQVRNLLTGDVTATKARTASAGPNATASRKKRVLSPEARARIVAAQKKRWAEVRKGNK